MSKEKAIELNQAIITAILEGDITYDELYHLERSCGQAAPLLWKEDTDYMIRLAEADKEWRRLWDEYVMARKERTLDELRTEVEAFNEKFRFDKSTLENGVYPIGTPSRTDKFNLIVRNGRKEINPVLSRTDILGYGTEIDIFIPQ